MPTVGTDIPLTRQSPALVHTPSFRSRFVAEMARFARTLPQLDKEPATPLRTSCLVCDLAVPVSLRQPTGRHSNLDVHSKAIREVSGCLLDAGRGRAAAVQADDEDLVPRESLAEVAAAVLCVGPRIGVVQPRLVPVPYRNQSRGSPHAAFRSSSRIQRPGHSSIGRSPRWAYR